MFKLPPVASCLLIENLRIWLHVVVRISGTSGVSSNKYPRGSISEQRSTSAVLPLCRHFIHWLNVGPKSDQEQENPVLCVN